MSNLPISEDFPTLASSVAVGKQRRGSKFTGGARKGWNIREQSTSTWATNNLHEVNEVIVEDISAPTIDEVPEVVLKTVVPKFTDKLTECSRLNLRGCETLASIVINKIQSQPIDSSDRFRKLKFSSKVEEFEDDMKDSDFTRAPEASTPNWRSFLPDQTLNREFAMLSNLRQLDLPMGPKTIEVLKKTSDAVKFGLPAESITAFADDMHRIELSTWTGEQNGAAVAERMRQRFGLRHIEKEYSERKVNIALPNNDISLSVGAGGEAEFIFDGDCADTLVRGMCYNEVKHLARDRAVKARDFCTYSVNKRSDYPIATRNTVITAKSAEDSRTMRERLTMNGVDAKKMHRDLVTGNWNGGYAKRECLLDLEWERHGCNGIRVMFANLGEQMHLVDRLMKEKSEFFMFCHVTMEQFNNSMIVSVPSSAFSVNDDIKFLKNLLEENGVKIHSISPIKFRNINGPQRIETNEKRRQCKIAINRRLFNVAIGEGEWSGHLPINYSETQEILVAERFDWDIEFPNDRDLEYDGVNSARVHFHSFDQGEKIAARVQRKSPCTYGEDAFMLNKNSKKGVFARVKLRLHYNVPVQVLALTKNRLKKLDEEWRATSHFSHVDLTTEQDPLVQWVRLITEDRESAPPGFTRLIVEGFPRSRVEKACAALLDVIRGDLISCGRENGETIDKKEAWLLTGIGRNLADVLAREALDQHNVLVDFNVLGKEIRLIGEDTTAVEEMLRKIALNRDRHIIRTLVSVCQPLYMNRSSAAIMRCGGTKMMEQVIEECRITPCLGDADKQTLRFEGTVAAFHRLKEFLADLDDTLRESAREEYEKLRKSNPKLEDASLSPLTSALTCPICFLRPTDFYRLEACGHVYCESCIYYQLESELTSRSLPLKCRREGCGCHFAASDLMRLLLGRDPEESAETGLEHLDEMKLQPLVKAIVTDALQTKKDRMFPCQSADCPIIFPVITEENSLAKCKSCAKTWCGSCGMETHRGFSCDDYKKIRDDDKASIATYLKDKSNYRKCPNTSCGTIIEKTYGCNHMECILCRTHFCYLCGHFSLTQGDIYAHMQEKHGGNGLNMTDEELVAELQIA